MFQLRDSLSSSLKIVQFHARFKVARSHFLCLLGKFLKPGNSPHSRRSAFTFHRIRSNFLSREKIHLRYPRTLFSLLSLSFQFQNFLPLQEREERDSRHAPREGNESEQIRRDSTERDLGDTTRFLHFYKSGRRFSLARFPPLGISTSLVSHRFIPNLFASDSSDILFKKLRFQSCNSL